VPISRAEFLKELAAKVSVILAVVMNGYHDSFLWRFNARPDGDVRALRSVLDGVINQVLQDAADQGAVGKDDRKIVRHIVQ
jgi:hypothetical protein